MLEHLVCGVIGFALGWVLRNTVYETNSELNMNELAAQLRADYRENLRKQSESPDVEPIRESETIHRADRSAGL